MYVMEPCTQSPFMQPQMLSDERLEKVERFVSESLNEDASLLKVCTTQTLIKGDPTT